MKINKFKVKLESPQVKLYFSFPIVNINNFKKKNFIKIIN